MYKADELRAYLERLSPTEFHSFYKRFDGQATDKFCELTIPRYIDVLLTNAERNPSTWSALLRLAGIYYDFKLYDTLLSSFLSYEPMWIEEWRWHPGTPEFPSRPLQHELVEIWSYGATVPTAGIEPELDCFLQRSPYFSCDYIDNTL